MALGALDRTADRRTPSARATDGLCMYTFIVLGVPDGMIGTAWPAIRHSFGVPLEDIGVVLLASTVGAALTSGISGLVVSRLGARATIMMAAVSGAAGALAVAAAPGLAALVAGGALIGVTAGFLDSSVNAMAALSGRGRLLNLLHGCYGVGTSIAPLVVTGALLVATSWRPAYGVLVALELALLAGWWYLGRARRPVEMAPAQAAAAPPPAAAAQAAPPQAPVVAPASPASEAVTDLRGARFGLVVAMGLFVFLVYTGLEVSAGQWEPSFDRGPLHMGAGPTGVAVFGYWGALTLGRMALAVPRTPPSPDAVVRWGVLIGLAGAAVVWWQPATWATLTGFAVMGAGLAGIFPALVTLTPGRVGERRAHHVIGWQIGAAGIGGSSISALFGVVFQHDGFRWMGPCLVLAAGALLAAAEALRRLGRPLAVRPL